MDFRKRFPLRLGRPDVDEEVDDELEFHLAMRTREMAARGLSELDARRAALEKFGDFKQARRQCRALGHQREQRVRIFQYVSELRQDAFFALRQMIAKPAFTTLALLTLTLGIGATTAIFSAVHAVVLRPLPFPEPERVVEVNSGWREGLMWVAPAHYLHLAEEQNVFSAIAAVERASFTLAREDGAERVIGARATGGFFDVFRVAPAIGRPFGPAEDEPGKNTVVVISHRFWKRQFGGDPSVIGRQITLNQRQHQIVGVMPEAFDFSPQREELWVPMAFSAERRAMRGNHFLSVYARLRDGVSLTQAAAQMPAILERRLQKWPDESAERTLHVTPMMERFVGDYRERLFVLLAAVALVLLIACANVSNLLLARGASRGRELAVRSALGAGTGRLVRQLFTESMVLGLLAAAAGGALAYALTQIIVAYGPPDVPRLDQARIDGIVLAFDVAVALAASVVFGVAPAWRASRTDVNATLKEAGRGAVSKGPRDLVRSALITAEVALAIVLLVGAGLLIRTSLELQRIDLGFDPQDVFTGRVLLPQSRYRTPDEMLRISRELEESVRRIPGVRSASVSSTVPFVPSFSNGLLPEGRALDLANITQTDGVMVSPSYFHVMGLRIAEGRAFTEQDRAGSPLVVILNRTAAQRMWPGQQAIGKRLTSANPTGATTVIGIAEDVRSDGPGQPAPPTFYVPFAQINEEAWGWSRALFIAARTDGDAARLAPSVRRLVAGIDPAIPLYSTMTMEQRMASTIETARFNTLLLAILGVVGMILAAVGIYGVVGYFASQRTAEIGIRMALGASRRDVVRLVVKQAAVPVATGLLIGALGAAFAARALASQLVNVRPADPLTFAVVCAVLLAIALLAALVPARRAARLDPSSALQMG